MRRFLLITWIAGIFCCLSNNAKAGIDNPVIQTLKGSLGQITVGANITVEDAKFFDPLYYGKLAKPYKLKSLISVEIDEDLRAAMPSSFSATIKLRITYLGNDSTTTTTVADRDFFIDYNAAGNYAHRNTFYIDNAVRVKVEVVSLTPSSGTEYNFLKVVNHLQSYPQYNFNCTDNAVQTVHDSAWAANTGKDELPVYWSPVIGADEYDLEWTYVDDSVLASGYYGTAGSYNADKIFENNASRVTITGTIYNIPVIYDNNGVLFYRVRSVQWQAGGGRNEANWSSSFGSGGLGEWDFDGHERPLNWQATTTFAEDGKRKTVVQYYDGSLRARQTVTKDNTTNRTIVAESFYDYQGRPVIQVLPAPTLSNIIKYNQGFNTGVNAAIYDKHEYDTLADPSFYCNTGAGPMDTLSGASRYYSPNNPLRDSGFHQYIPDAKRYPFTEVEYTQDNTGRISRQSGVGAEYKIGSGHETKYFYGTADQRELDALFGTEVGDASHYFKTMVRDANGQYSVSYTDMRGRTIATALAGVPDSVKLDTLSSYSAFERTEALTTPQSTTIKDLVMEGKKSLLVAKAGFHTFTYKLDSSLVLQDTACNQVKICYECLYDLRITITDDCNNQKLPDGKAFDTLVRNFSIGNIDTSCHSNSGGFNITFIKWLEKGNYEITKQLSVSRTALEYYRDSIFLAANTCKTIDTFVQQQRAIMAAITECAPSCESCLLNLGDWNAYWLRFRQKAGIADQDTADYKQMAYQAYLNDSLSCDELCERTTEYHDIRKAMLMDMTPSSGQYANLDKADDKWSVFYADQDGMLPDTTAKYQLVTDYRDENGNPDMVFDEGAGMQVAPQQLSPEMFAQKFKNSWAEALLPYHPEYCKLVRYDSLNYSHAWDRRFESVDTWAEAMQKGYLNPTNEPGAPYNAFTGTDTLDTDPLAGLMGGQLNDSLTKYRYVTNPGYYVTMWSVATMSAMCGKDDNACYQKYRQVANAFNSDSLCEAELNMAWRSFRQMYLDVKRKLVNAYINQAPCNTSMTAAQIVAAGYSPHFSDADELLAATGKGLPPDKNQALNLAKDSMDNYTVNTCEAYAYQWWQQLKPCKFPDSLENSIISRLVAICQEGSDVNHPYGASSVKPSSVYPYRSFEAFLEFYCDSIGIDINAVCHPYLITAPKPYDQQVSYNNKPVYRPDSCECSTISKYYVKFQAATSFDSFGNYLRQVYKTNLSDSVINLLLNMCSIGGGSPANCTYFKDIVNLPPLFQCYTGDVCVNCSTFKTLDSTFRNKYPGVLPLESDSLITDSAQLAWNSMYEQYLNHQLGYTKTTADYLAFRAQCATGWSGTACDTLQQLLVDYRALFHANYGLRLSYYTAEGETISDYHQTFHDGVFQLPDTIRQRAGSWYNSMEVLVRGGYRFCWSDGYAVEARMKYIEGDYSGQLGDLLMVNTQNFMCLFAKQVSGLYLVSVQDGHGNKYGTLYGGTTFDSILVESSSGALNEWFTVKLKVSPSHYYVYHHDSLVFDVARDTSLLIAEQPNYFISSRTRNLGVDWLKMYDASGQVRYFEDFLDPDNPILPDDNYICPIPFADCQDLFVTYFNAEQETSYTASQVDSVYLASCGRSVEPCPDTLYNRLVYLAKTFVNLYYGESNPYTGTCTEAFATHFNNYMGTGYTFTQLDSLYEANVVYLNVCNLQSSMATLCGRAEPVFPLITTAPIDNCSDSSFFIASKAQEFKRIYDDSLRHYFDSSYVAKCMQAYKLESFTVRHAVSEYHYTLYYYDQAGNLVKTIAPAGVQPNYDSLWLDSVAAARMAGAFKVPAHVMPTQYRYNTLNQVKSQQSPDGGKTDFWYDRLGRLALSRNARQRTMSSAANNYYSYTRYDTLGRITEVGQIRDTSVTSPIDDSFTRNETNLTNWFYKNNKYRAQITNTVYDIEFFTDPYNPQWVAQKNLRNRVSYVSYKDTVYDAAAAYNQASFYSYDIHGNVDTLVQDYGFGGCCNTALWNVMNRNGNRWKKLIYQYDLISGKVNQVMYQKGWADQWFHRYSYDAENWLILAETSLDSMVWERDARYEYYLHGPLARTVLGDQQVQGMDYAYTLQGWLKGINSTGGTIAHDIGGDGKASHIHQYTARDAIGLTLNYFEGEYKPISLTVNPFPNYKDSLVHHNAYRPLYNGNISSMSTYLRGMIGSTPDEPLLFNNYRYDQLNRLTGQDVYYDSNRNDNGWTLKMLADTSYRERVSYDGNGNILTYKRNGNKAKPYQLMDDLTYTYYNGTNQLRHVDDAVDAGRYGGGSFDMDIDDQSVADNYKYDSIGNIISDAGEGITNIKWNVYGKITEIIRVSNGFVPLDTIRYSYDAMGNRIGKAKRLSGKWDYTWYVRDAQGNVIATYDDDNEHTDGYIADPAAVGLSLSERYMYGSSRLGLTSESIQVDNGNNGPGSMEFYSGSMFYRGKKRYELTNHLGNVLTIISDKKLGVSSGGSLIDYYNPEIKSAQDYYPFGMTMPGRFPLGGAPYYKYTFNGKENDWEAKGWQNQQDYGMRVYDPRLGRFLSVDPLTKEYPWFTAYQFAGNTPIQATDLDGAEQQVRTYSYTISNGKPVLKVTDEMHHCPPSGSGSFHIHPIGIPPTDKQLAAYNEITYRRPVLPGNGNFAYFEFAPELGKENYAKYTYLDKNGQWQVEYSTLADMQFRFGEIEAARNERYDDINKAAAIANLVGAGWLLKTELKAAAGELKALSGETSAGYSKEVTHINGTSIKNLGFGNQTVNTKGGPVTFDEYGFPDFRPYSIKNVQVKGLTGDYAIDEALTLKAAKMKATPKDYVWHHHQDAKTMMLVPKTVNNPAQGGVGHTGGAAVIKHNKNNPNNQLKFPSP